MMETLKTSVPEVYKCCLAACTWHSVQQTKTHFNTTPSSDELTQQLGQYLTEVQTISFGARSAFIAFEFWKTRQAI